MDNQNKTNQPFDQGTAPVVPNVPEDITPQTPPAPTPPITPPTIPEPMSTPLATPPLSAPVPEVFPVPAPTLVITETPVPESKPKKKIMPIIGGIVALLLVVGVAGAAYYVSNRLALGPVAPNAPTSKPLATCRDSGTHLCDTCCAVESVNPTNSDWCVCEAAEVTEVSVAHSTCNWSACGAPYCVGTECVKSCNCTANCDPNECWTDASGCPNDCGGGGGDGDGGVGGTACTRSGSGVPGSCYKNTTESNVCNDAPFTFGCGMECCNTSFGGNAGIACCCTGCFPAGTDCSQHSCDTTSPTASPTVAPVDGGWSVWSACSATTCGTNGTKTRTCNNPAPVNGGAECTRTDGTKTSPTNRTETIACSAESCTGACMLINIYKKVDGVYGTAPLTTAQLQALKVGDVLKFTLTSNTDNLKGRFRVTVAGVGGTWLNGVIDATNKKLVFYDNYTVATAGTYKFEAQVSTTP